MRDSTAQKSVAEPGVLPVPSRRRNRHRPVDPPRPRAGPLLGQHPVRRRRASPRRRQGRVGDAGIRVGRRDQRPERDHVHRPAQARHPKRHAEAHRHARHLREQRQHRRPPRPRGDLRCPPGVVRRGSGRPLPPRPCRTAAASRSRPASRTASNASRKSRSRASSSRRKSAEHPTSGRHRISATSASPSIRSRIARSPARRRSLRPALRPRISRVVDQPRLRLHRSRTSDHLRINRRTRSQPGRNRPPRRS